ncbi:MAG: efflux RND transporter periplasmic adaptor subunit [Chitinophagaceae bacterium]|nr:MAG: efflux RND transporter periplasmic adaptor subunit [Chitinophagaceae bacterium]
MRKKNSYIVLMIITFAGLLIVAGCQPTKQKQESATKQAAITEVQDSTMTVSLTPEQYRNAGIRLGNTEERKLHGILQVNGMVEVPPQSKISVTFPYGGFVRKINALEGSYVKKGALLAVLENPEYVDLQENYLKNKTALEYARQEYNRQKELYKADVAAGKTYQKAKSDYESLSASVKALEQKLDIMGIRAETLTPDNISSIINITAPDNGYVTKVLVNKGKYVNAQEELLEVNNNRDMLIDLTVYEKDISSIRTGQEVGYTLTGSSQPEQKAKIILIGREIRPDRSVVVHAVPENKNQQLLPGAYVQAFISQSGTLSEVLPAGAVVRSEGKQYIFIREKVQPYSFRMIPVQVGTESDGYLQIKLSEKIQIPDSSIVTNGAFSLLSVLKNKGEEE